MDNIQAGQMVGPYRILHQIGQGGMATVFKAYHAAMDRYVAVKILPRQLAESPEFSGRFRQEARVIARLEHAHILPVHDYGESAGYTYLVMRLLEAGTLRDRLRAAQMPLPEVDRLFTQLADALEYAHAQGVIHRDLKPSNVLLDSRANAFLTDFGIAKLLESDAQYTGTGALIGTPAYMSPEQAQGRAVDQRSDIYSLGIILYEMLTGRVPFDADTPLAIILKHLNEPLPLPSSLRPDLSPAVEAVLLKALSKNPADRFASATQFVAAWKAALQTLGPATELREGSGPFEPTEVDAAVVAPPPSASRPSAAQAAPPARPPSFAGVAQPAGPAPRPALPQSPVAPPAAGRSGVRKAATVLTPVGLVAALGLLACGAVVCGYFVYNGLANRPAGTSTPRPAATVTTGAEPTAAATAETLPTFAATPFVLQLTPEPTDAAGKSWASWTSANTVVTLGYLIDTLLSGGPGGVTCWDSSGQTACRLTTGDGLPGAYVTALLIEDDGKTLWIATDNGLLQFADNKVHLFDSDSGLDSSAVTALLRTDAGLLIGTQYSGKDGGGLLLFADGRWQEVPGFPSGNTDEQPDKLSNAVTSLAVDGAGHWWVGTDNGLGRFDGQNWTRYTDADGLPDKAIKTLGVVDGQVWAGTDGGAARFDGQSFASLGDLGISPVYGILATADGTVWLTGGGGAARRNPGSSDWKLYDSQQMPGNTLYTALEAPDGAIFIGSDNGIVRFQGTSFSVWSVPDVPSNVSFGRILPDLGTDNLWFVEEYGSSLDSFDVAQQSWSPEPSLPCNDCVPLVWDADGRLWAGGQDGVWIIAGQNVQHLTADDGLPSNEVSAVAFAKDGEAWIGTAAGVAVYDGQSVKAVYTAAGDGLADDHVLNILAAADGSLWVATEKYLSHFTADGRWEHYGPRTPFGEDVRVTDLAEDAGGAIWATTDGDGVYRYRDRKWEHFSPDDANVGVPIANMNCVTAAPDGSLWFGGNYSGAVHFDGEQWQAFGITDGLIHSNVNDILIQDSGEVWFATSGGVTRYRP